MRWDRGRRSGNIEDRRGLGPVAGGVGIGGLVLAAIGYFVFGIDPSTTLSAVEAVGGGGQAQQEGARGTPADREAQFVDVIETSTSDVWGQVFKASNRSYDPPAGVVIYDRATGTGCGMGQSAMGPFYCPQDRKVYLDLAFWEELSGRFGAQGEAARAYVIAHEVAHHVQNLTGQMDKAKQFGAKGVDSGSVRLELQADCYAGVWAARASEASGGQVSLDPKDIEDGLKAAAAVGDDTLQKQSQGRVMPDAFTHGTSEQRMRWFRAGVQNGDPAACDTFGASRL
ncbi:MAG: neutral zinc metallopeptidase [Phenylobacterium sp.]|uniref:KPN_02809 family neutral zinc metallopeptidase n=1 Tax=Phenylobacterium sp. TaxID=1871053 RepID=UPI001B62E856|nr:neutral zinc metallopeptidase [Phenylobacterium sp.]MBP7651219.1 neutral zinc metallopeptidase [Phenylobacterium sp.]MBP7815327.1 neutral zinc metallopeptidase [Phenylobacterium sp.]MBP9231387.1 neutral zinc metallopeptidase [Phenylobacterium sp.]MBP9754341.1 neutral zinc metallopeptidase [Phenylobacterium sp.]